MGVATNQPDQEWAVVTGASSGIGAAIAEKLAAAKWNVVLVGRNAELLEETAAVVRRQNAAAEIVLADLATPDGLARVKSFAKEKNLAVGILVNNAGFGIHDNFATSDIAEELKMVDLQMKAALDLTKSFLPDMLHRKRGRILNVASVYAFSPVPNQAVYSACKAFLLSWTRTLALELHGTGVTVSVLCPGITQTRFRSRAGMKDKKSSFSMTSEAVADIGVSGMLRGKTVIVPGWHNWLYTTLASCLPAWLLGKFTLWFNRRRGLANAAGNTH